jgi:riboflavin synthase
MFTGIINNISHVKKSQDKDKGILVTFELPENWKDLQIGESISTNGVCLTVLSLDANEYSCFLMPETLARTTFGKDIPARVNVERALKADERFGGHFVQGHIDDLGYVTEISKKDEWVLSIKYDLKYSPLVIEKGSITIDGVSLTISKLNKNNFSVSLIPFTLKHTTLGDLAINDEVNLEFDILGKYINRIMEKYKDS